MFDKVDLPTVPKDLLDEFDSFRPSPEFAEFAYEAFIAGPSPLLNPDHEHLQGARIGFVLTTATEIINGAQTLGRCHCLPPSGKPWQAARSAFQIKQWFGYMPDFMIMLDAVWLSTAKPGGVCALIEHELYHANMKRDEFGSPKYTKDGIPAWGIKPHDVEEFAGVVKRYGGYTEGLASLIQAARQEPEFGPIKLGGICGCGARL